MKKLVAYIFILSGLASCVKEAPGSGNSLPAEGTLPINVSASTVSLNRTKNTLINDLGDLKASTSDLSLYSYAHFGTDSKITSILNNAKLSWTGSSWAYSPVQYWMTSAIDYHFSAVYPFIQGRISPTFTYPTASDDYVLGLQPKVYPMYEKWSAEDYAQGAIIYKSTKTLYLTKSMVDVMFGETSVSPERYGDDVEINLKHAGCAVRFRMRNLSEKPFALTNWYMTGLKNHADMVINVVGCPDDYEPLRFMSIVPDSKISEIKITSFGQENAKDSVKFAGDSHWTICADGGVAPGHEDYFKYVLLSSRLKEVGSTWNLSHTHSADGLTITYYDGTGKSWTDPKKFMAESTVYQNAVAEVQAIYQYTFPNYKASIFWGPAHYLDSDCFFIPLVYEHGAQITDFNADRVRGDSGDYDLMVHQFECRSHMFEQSSGVWKANGGLYLPVNGNKYANLYSPYFFSAENHGAIAGDWKEGMVTDRWNDTDPNYPYGKQRSVFLWTADNSNPQLPLHIDNCIAHYNVGDKEYTPSVKSGDLADILNDNGYLLMFPQTLENLDFHFYTAPDADATGNPSTARHNAAPTHHSFNLKKYTPGGEWRSGYQYDYTITVSSSAIVMQLDVEPWDEREINLD